MSDATYTVQVKGQMALQQLLRDVGTIFGIQNTNEPSVETSLILIKKECQGGRLTFQVTITAHTSDAVQRLRSEFQPGGTFGRFIQQREESEMTAAAGHP